MAPETKKQTIFALNAKIFLKPECKDGFMAVIKKDQAQTLAVEPGAVHFVVGQDSSDPNVLYLHEQYKTHKDYEFHQTTPHFAEFAGFIGSAEPFAQDPVVDGYYLDTDNSDHKSTKNAYCLHVESCVKPELRDEFVELMKGQQTSSQAEEGCLQFEWGESTKGANAFYVHAKYQNQAAYEAHEASEHVQKIKAFEKEKEPYSKPQVVSYYNTIAGEPQDLVNAIMVKERVWKRKRADIEDEEKVIEIEEEPRHSIDFANKYTRIITIRMDPNDTTLAHRHTKDTIIFILMKNGVDFINDVMGCGAEKGHMEYGQVGFAPYTSKPCVHKITNLSPERFFVINVEVLDKPPVSQAKALMAPHHELVKEQPNCRIYKLSLKPGESAPINYLFFYVRVVLEGGVVQVSMKDISWEEDLKMGDSEWKEPMTDGTLKNTGNTLYVAFICELLRD